MRGARIDLVLAVALTVAGVLEALLGPADEGSRLVSAVAIALATLPLAWRRTVPLLPLVAIAIVLPLQEALDGIVVGHMFTLLPALVLAIYSAGRGVAGAGALAAAVAALAALTTTRIVADPGVRDAGDAILTAVAVTLPFLVGRWANGQERLQRRLEARARRLDRDRERDAYRAAEEERLRIAADLQAAIAGGLREIVRGAEELPSRLGEPAAARGLLTSIAATAREALADVRRVLGVLRRDGQAPRVPPDEDRLAVVAAPPADFGVARRRDRSAPHVDSDVVRGRPRSISFGEAWLDRALVAILLAGAELEIALVTGGTDRVLGALTAATIVAPLLARRRHPIAVALAVLGAIAVQSALLGLERFPVADGVSLVCASYAVGAYAERRRAIAGIALVVLGDAAHAAVFHPEAVAIAVLGAAVVPWTIGRIVRGQRELTREARRDAAQIERRRALEEQAAVMGERTRVARELHDAVAHNISVIAIQAAGASGIVERDPRRAVEIAALIEAVAREATVELGRLAAAPATDGAGTPEPSLARVDELAQRARDGGLPVELRVEGEPARIPAGVDLAAFRIVQEALANASKHAGDARAQVVVRYRSRALEVEIADDGRGPNGGRARNGSGHGLVGMRERAALYGGTLDAGGRRGGGFEVRATLPLAGT